MVSIVKIAEVLGLAVADADVGSPVITRLSRIAEKVKSKFGQPGFEEEVLAADAVVGEEGGRAFMQAFGQCVKIETPAERVYKIKRSAKGQRIDVKSESGVRFSFGPTWNDSVVAAKGIALNENNREKLNMHGTHLGVASPEKMSARELCSAIAERLSQA